MFIDIKDGIAWALALSKYDQSRFDEARSLLKSIRGKRRSYSEYYALLGAVTLALNYSAEAKDLFLKSRDHSLPKKENYSEYVINYCNYYISSIEGNEGYRAKFLERSKSIVAPAIIKRWLPLS